MGACCYTWRVNDMQCIYEDEVEQNEYRCIGNKCEIYKKVNNEFILGKIEENNKKIENLTKENNRLMFELC